jgi:hypothetical protein
MLVPRSAAENGYAMDQSFDANSSFERPATKMRPLLTAMSMIDWLRALPAVGAFGRDTFEYLSESIATSERAPDPSSRSSAGLAAAPTPRITEMYDCFVFGCTARSVIAISLAAVPSIAAIFWSMP